MRPTSLFCVLLLACDPKPPAAPPESSSPADGGGDEGADGADGTDGADGADGADGGDSAGDTGEIVWPEPTEPPMVILMIGDGMGFEHVKGGGIYKNGAAGSLAMETMPYQGRVRTASLTGTTDSAAAGTAMACGEKTWNGRLGLDKEGFAAPNLTEAALSRGMATGVVTRDKLYGATPSAFLVHLEDRYEDEAISTAITEVLPTVLLGGGFTVMSPLIDPTAVTLVTTRDELLAAPSEDKPLVGLFAAREMPFVVEDPLLTPSLVEMTTTALDRLDDDPEGFFLMVEGARIDHASHSNLSSNVHPETAAFDDAIAAVLAFAALHDNVTVLVTADHECGGLEVTDAGVVAAGTIPETRWRWGKHTNADVPVFGWGARATVFDGVREDDLWVNQVLRAAIDELEFAPPEVPAVVDGWMGDLGAPVSVQTWDTDFGAGYNQLDALYLLSDEDGIRVGVDGVFAMGNNAALVLVDMDYGASTGLGADDFALIDPYGVTDTLLGGLNLEVSVPGVGFDLAAVELQGYEINHGELNEYAGIRGFNDRFGAPEDMWWMLAMTNFDDGNRSTLYGPARDSAPTGTTEGGFEALLPWTSLYPEGLPTAGLSIAISVILVDDTPFYASNQALPPLASSAGVGSGTLTLEAVVQADIDASGALLSPPVVIE